MHQQHRTSKSYKRAGRIHHQPRKKVAKRRVQHVKRRSTQEYAFNHILSRKPFFKENKGVALILFALVCFAILYTIKN
jgi:hypothetical protein